MSHIWRKIGEMSMPGKQLKKKWHQLQSNYMIARRNDKNKPSGSGAKPKTTTWPYYEVMKFLDPGLESRSTSGNVAFEQQLDMFYMDHAGNMNEMTLESMLEGSTPEILWTSGNCQNEKELEAKKEKKKLQKKILIGSTWKNFKKINSKGR
ncbi:hypothetical protein TNIN_202911 [Trichonephila inaurata madagascariensis]|uniref:MADF domain-containing protein n=1 Tax=Trichonephila inaurata madagascariensis TaxID=2747483 RepID=A0A8X6X3G7_9ARAC|nr:hypothetical protein TNIN_202911 [Trichonephila inaurata madagascariensis]